MLFFSELSNMYSSICEDIYISAIVRFSNSIKNSLHDSIRNINK